MAELTVTPSPHVETCYVARCSLCPTGWVSLARPERVMARNAGIAHMARTHPGAWSGVVAELEVAA